MILMKTQNFQDKLDRLINNVFLWAIPISLKPNFFSFLRISLVPIIFYLLTIENLEAAFAVFIVAVSTDFIDGALARTRNQVTDLGKLLDPIADKMLILTVLVYIGFSYLIIWVFAIFIVFEIVAVLASALFARYLGRPIGANVFGKVKMVLQSISVILFFVGLILVNNFLIKVSEYTLFLALVFAVLAGLVQVKRRLAYWRIKKEAR